MQYILYVIGILIIIFFHEIGHMFVALLFRFHVKEVAIGFGPTLVSVIIHKIRFKLKLIPLGGFCTIEEFDDESVDSNENIRILSMKRILVFLAGPVVNFLMAIIIFFSIGNIDGLPISANKSTELNQQGIVEGDILRSINDKRVFSKKDINELLCADKTNILTIVKSDGQRIYCEYSTETNGMNDVEFNTTMSSRLNGLKTSMYSLITIVGDSVIEVFDGSESMISDMENPYSRLKEDVTTSVRYKFNKFLLITGVVSFCLSVFNLLPFAFFDGFRILIAIGCLIFNRKINENLLTILSILGIILFLVAFF